MYFLFNRTTLQVFATYFIGVLQGAAERSPLFRKLINSKPKKMRQMFF